MSRVLVARQDSDGDVLLAGPAIRAVAAAGDDVTLLCGPRGRQAASLLPGVDELLVAEAAWIDPHPSAVDERAVGALVGALRDVGADRALVLVSDHQSPLPLALLLRMAGVGEIAAVGVDYPGSLLDHRVADPGDVHEVTRNLLVAEALGYRLPTGDDGRLAIRRSAPVALGAVAPPYVVVHPGASVPARAWEPDRCEALVRALAADGTRVVVTGSADEMALTARVAGTDGIDLGGRTALGALAEVLAAADCVVVGNTGPAHLAAAVGTPVISLFAPTVPAARWRPWGVQQRLLSRPVACAGCRARQCPVAGHPCLAGVTVGDVIGAVRSLTRETVLAGAAA